MNDLTAKARRTRAALIEAGQTLIGRDGVTGINVMAVCGAAGVGRTSYYNYFDDVEGLIAAIAIQAARDIKERFDRLHVDHPRGMNRLEACFGMILNLSVAEPEMVLLITSLAHESPEVGQLLQAEIRAELAGETGASVKNSDALAGFLTVTLLAIARQLANGTLAPDQREQYLEFLLKSLQ